MVGTTNSSMRDTYGWHEAMTNKLLTDGSPVSLAMRLCAANAHRLSVADQPALSSLAAS